MYLGYMFRKQLQKIKKRLVIKYFLVAEYKNLWVICENYLLVVYIIYQINILKKLIKYIINIYENLLLQH